MPSSAIKRMNRRKKAKELKINYDEIDISKLRTEKIDYKSIEESNSIISDYYDTSVSDEEARQFLIKFKEEFNDKRFAQLINDCKKDVINSIVIPFGLGKIVAAYDKVGGNVDTVHNVRDGIYATNEEQQSYDKRGEYNSDEYHKDNNFKNINKQHSQDRKDGNATDYMTGDKLDPNQSHDLDHIKSAKEIHDDRGRVLAEIDGSKLANTETNLSPTTAGSNRTKKADTMKEFLAKKNERLKKIEDLKNKDSLSSKEQNELKKLEELSKIDDKKAMEADKKARQEIDNEINKTYYTSEKFIKNTTKEGVAEGSKMGMQQALGLVITEFFTALFDEIVDIYKNGFYDSFDDPRFFDILKNRLNNIVKKIKAKWKDVVIAFKDGFLSGFLSSLVTTVINSFVTTGKRVVRIIREGLFSLFKAIKILIFPPEGMSFEDRMYEAKKLLATGVITAIGIFVEQAVDTWIKTTVVLEPFSDILTTILIGALTGVAITMVTYYLDKKKNDKDAIQELISQTNEKYENIEKILSLELN